MREVSAVKPPSTVDGLTCGEVCRLLNMTPRAVPDLAEDGALPWNSNRHGERRYDRATAEAMEP